MEAVPREHSAHGASGQGVTTYIRYRRDATVSPAAERLRTALILWGVLPRGADLESMRIPLPQASEKNG